MWSPDRELQFTKLKGFPGALRDASTAAWGLRVIQAGASIGGARPKVIVEDGRTP